MIKTKTVGVIGLALLTSCSFLMDRAPRDYKPVAAPHCSDGAAAPLIDLILMSLNIYSIAAAANDPNASAADVWVPVGVGTLFFAGTVTGFSGASHCKKVTAEWDAVLAARLKPAAPTTAPNADALELERLRAEKAARDAADLERLRREERERLEREKLTAPAPVDAGVPDVTDAT